MLGKKKALIANNSQAAFSLVELMIAIALGLLVAAAVTAMTVKSLTMNNDTLKSARLNQDLDTIMQIMINDIRRAGYGADTVSFAVGEDINIVSSACLLYSYDRNENGTIDDAERNGFKLDGSDIEMRTSCNGGNCSTSCLDAVGNWEKLTDPDVIDVTQLTIDSEDSKCHNIDKSISLEVKSDTSATDFACSETTRSNIEEWDDSDTDPANWDWSSIGASTVLPLRTNTHTKADGMTGADRSIGIRHVNLSIQGELTNDSSISKALDVSIKVRNNHIY